MKIQDANRRLHRLVTIQWVVIGIVAIQVLIIFIGRLLDALGTH